MEQTDLLVAIRALWLLYLRSRWDELKRLGLSRKQAEPVLQEFDLNKFGSSHRLTGKRQVYGLLTAYPPLVEAAVRLVGVYMVLNSEEIKQAVKE